MGLSNRLVERLTLSLSNVKLKLRGLPATITSGESTSAPRATTVDLIEVSQHAERRLVSERDVDETVVHKRAHAGDSGSLLAATEGTSRNEDTGVFAPERTLLPLLAGLVPEGLELCGEVAVAGGNTEEDSVEFFENGGVVEGWDGGVLSGRVHLVEDVLGKGLGNSGGGLVDGLEGDEGNV